jgi:glycosyltransferase involved in cell wall biosynthesis
MRILYLAPRYHTNQTAIMRGWKNNGDEVKFISYYTAPIEDYTDLRPVVLGFAGWYRAFYHIYAEVIHRRRREAMNNKITYGYPPVRRLRKEILSFHPDIAILRDRTIYSMRACDICRANRIPCILYNQSPLWDDPPKTDFFHRYVYRHTPDIRITPVLGHPGAAGKSVAPHSYYVPFAVEPGCAPEERQYFDGGALHILCIGKFEPRKHHLMLMRAVQRLRRETGRNLLLTVIGEASGHLQKDYYQEVREAWQSEQMEEFVTLQANVSREGVRKLYLGTDLFVIPSTLEMASVSQLEAMSYSIPVICSDTNGTACYVEDGVNGRLFRDCDEEDLYRKLEEITRDENELKKMGADAYKSVKDRYSFENYHESILRILRDNFGVKGTEVLNRE